MDDWTYVLVLVYELGVRVRTSMEVKTDPEVPTTAELLASLEPSAPIRAVLGSQESVALKKVTGDIQTDIQAIDAAICEPPPSLLHGVFWHVVVLTKLITLLL